MEPRPLTSTHLAVHLRHLSGKLDLRGVGQLGVQGGGGSFEQLVRAIIHLERGGNDQR